MYMCLLREPGDRSAFLPLQKENCIHYYFYSCSFCIHLFVYNLVARGKDIPCTGATSYIDIRATAKDFSIGRKMSSFEQTNYHTFYRNGLKYFKTLKKCFRWDMSFKTMAKYCHPRITKHT